MNITSPRQLIQAIPELFRDATDQTILLATLVNGQIGCTSALSVLPEVDSSHAVSDFLAANQSDDTALVAIAYGCTHEQAETSLNYVKLRSDDSGTHVLDLLHVWNGRWRSILCSDEECCPQDGHPLAIEVDSEAHTDSIGEAENAAFDSEFSLAFTVLGSEEEQARDAAFSGLTQYPSETAEELLEIRNARVQETVNLLIANEAFDWESLATTCSVISDIRCRDGVLRQIFEQEENRSDVCRGLTQVLALAPEDHRASVATTLAGALWLDGHRALTRKLIDLALEADETYSLARLLDTALQHGVPHRVWVDSLAAVTYEKCLVGAA